MRFKLLLLGIALTLGAYLKAATLSVTNPANSGAGTLRDQIAAANPGDKIFFATTDTIRLTSGISISVANLEISGFGGPEVVIMGANSHRLFAANADSIKFKYLTFTKGRVYGGGSQAKGGAIYTAKKGIEVQYCNFVSNRVHNTSGTSGGGAIAVVAPGTMTVDNSHFTQNTSQNCVGGGAIFLHQSGSKITVTNSSFYDNIAQNNLTGSRGGAVCCWLGVARFENCTFSNNGVDNTSVQSYAYGNGGAIAAMQGGKIELINNTIVNNYVNVYPDDSNNGGAGVFVDHGSISHLGDFMNNLIGNNLHTVTSTNQIIESDFTIFGGTETSQGYNLIQNLTGAGTLNTQSTDILNQSPNVGGLTTLSDYHKYHPIDCSSPGWNAGSSNITAFMDQLSVNRNVHGAVDMGSIEFQDDLPESPELSLVHNICANDTIGEASIVSPSKKISHSWSTGEDGNGITNVGAGTYYVTTTNNHGCSVIDTFTITSPDSISIPGVVSHDNGNSSGAVDITVSGGTPGYTYFWNPGANYNEDISNLDAGDYTVTVQDANGCEKEKTFTINMTTGIQLVDPRDVLVYPNPAQNFITINTDLDVNTIFLQSYDGKKISIENNQQVDLSHVAKGPYLLQIITKDGRQTTKAITIK